MLSNIVILPPTISNSLLLPSSPNLCMIDVVVVVVVVVFSAVIYNINVYKSFLCCALYLIHTGNVWELSLLVETCGSAGNMARMSLKTCCWTLNLPCHAAAG